MIYVIHSIILVVYSAIIHQSWLYFVKDLATSSWSIVVLQSVGIIFVFSILLFVMFCFSLIIHLSYLHGKEFK